MATAGMKARTNTSTNGGTAVVPDSVSMKFAIVEDNGGNFHWSLLDRDGHDLARSPNFVSSGDAENAGLAVLTGVVSARLDRRAEADGSSAIPSGRTVPMTAQTA